MTTESKQDTPRGVTCALLGALVACGGAGLGCVVMAALLSGTAAAYGALIGAGLVVVVLAFGSFSVNLVSQVMPSASLVVALVTYTLQVVVMALAFVVLSSSDLLDARVDAVWLGATVIVATVAWMLLQTVLTTRLRIPLYDLDSVHR